MDRRTALTLVGALVGYMNGKPIAGQSAPAIFLALDGIDAIVVRRRGVQVVINPDELIAALAPPQPFSPMQQMPNPNQYPRGK